MLKKTELILKSPSAPKLCSLSLSGKVLNVFHTHDSLENNSTILVYLEGNCRLYHLVVLYEKRSEDRC